MAHEKTGSEIALAVVSLWAEDVTETVKFYRDVIGLQLISAPGERPHFRLGETYLVILQGRPVAAKNATPERFPVLALRVNDLDLAIDHLEAHGIKKPLIIERDEHTRWVMFTDPAGNLIELVQGYQ